LEFNTYLKCFNFFKDIVSKDFLLI